MTLPSLTRTWRFKTNVLIAGSTTTSVPQRNFLMEIKDAILGNGSWTDSDGVSASAPTGWSVAGSCNSSVAGMDGVDRWVTGANIIMGSGAHSWIVFRHATIGDILISGFNASGFVDSITVAWSPTGYGTVNGGTDGTTTADPTATAAVTLYANAGAGSGTNSPGVSTRAHFLRATDGGFIFLFCRNGFLTGLFDVSLVGTTLLDVGTWAKQVACVYTMDLTDVPSSHGQMAFMQNATSARLYRGVRATTALTFENMSWARTSGSSATFWYPDAIYGVIGDFIFSPAGVFSVTTSNVGPYGFLSDRYWCQTAADKFGFPDDGAAEWVNLGNRVFPWNKGTIQLS